jgi:hypothetical protein
MSEEKESQKEDIKPLFITRLYDMYYELFELVAVVVLAILSVITVSEMSSRESFSNNVSNKIASLNVDLANIAVSLTSNLDAKINDAVYTERKDATIKIEQFEELNDKVSTLITVGVDDQSGVLKELIKSYQRATARFDETSSKSESELAQNILENLSSSYYIGFIYEMRSDHLLALSIISCSALGAMIFGLRSGTRMNVRTLTSGLATGFIVYLALKGGQHLFLLTSPDVRIPSNPYSSAFLGLLAGLFSDKAYKVLSSLVDDLASRVENATNGNGNKS